MQIKFEAKELKVAVADEHGHVALRYEVSDYLFDADVQQLVEIAKALAIQINTVVTEVM